MSIQDKLWDILINKAHVAIVCVCQGTILFVLLRDESAERLGEALRKQGA